MKNLIALFKGAQQLHNKGQSNAKYERLIKVIDDLHPFVFILSEKDIERKFGDQFESDLDDNLDLPFKTCSFEYSDMKFGRKLHIAHQADGSTEVEIQIHCMIVNEVAPKKYEFWFLSRDEATIAYFDYHDMNKNEEAKILYLALVNFLRKVYLDQIKNQDIGVAKTNERIKYKIDGVKKTKKIKNITYITSSKTKPSTSNNLTINWDYSHRWEVRGHWRVCKGIGKDRQGEYCVNGFTWVKPHEKGPEDKPLIKKTRIKK